MIRHYLLSIFRALLFALIGTHSLMACTQNDQPGNGNLPVTKVSIIPQPQSVQYGTSDILLPGSLTISEDITGISKTLLTETLSGITAGGTVATAPNAEAFIRVSANSALAEEAYNISIGEKSVNLEYSTPKGMLWGIQTLRQILLQSSDQGNGRKSIPALELSDYPRTQWRGFHIDVSRHMFTLDFLKKLTDCLSFYKINKLRLHLNDDQGWRSEIKKYPQLTTIGGWREFDEYDLDCMERAKTDPDFTIDSRFIRNGNEYGGYYTQEELKGLIEYATERGLEVIPEIDMPGHFSSAIKAFPELSCTGQAGWGEEFSYPVCAGKTENYPFFKDIIDEVVALFPGEYMHIGADEVEKINWKECPRCQALIREKQLMNVDGLQNYFVKEMAGYVRSKGKKVIAWDDAFNKNDPQDLLYTYWRDWLPEQAADITQRGYKLVFMEWGRFYLSGSYSDDALKSLYEFTFEPQFPGIVTSNVAGFQACVWTEHIPNEKKLGQHVFPSLQAFTELVWSNRRDWESFKTRLPWHLQWLTRNGVHSRKPAFIP